MNSVRRRLLCSVCLVFALGAVFAGCKGETNESHQVTTGGGSSEAEIRSLPYLNWVPIAQEDTGKHGVTKYIQEESDSGINIYSSRPLYAAHLLSMTGKIIHTWKAPTPFFKDPEGKWEWLRKEKEGWHHIEMSEGGNLFVMSYMSVLMKLDWDSNLQWKSKVYAHHDIAHADNGDIYTITSERLEGVPSAKGYPVVDNSILVLNANGRVKRKISLYRAFNRGRDTARVLDKHIKEMLEVTLDRQRDRQRRIEDLQGMLSGGTGSESKRGRMEEEVRKLQREQEWARQLIDGSLDGDKTVELLLFEKLHKTLDIFHTNSVEILRHGADGLWNKGDLLLSSRRMDMVFVLDSKTEVIKWSWGPGQVNAQHHPSMLDSGNLLIFDNGQRSSGSRIVELDPWKKQIVWQYVGTPPESFYTKSRGGVQKLPSGNVLITESKDGHVFEITPQGKVVWDFYNPVMKEAGKKKGKRRAPIYRMMRLDKSLLKSLPFAN